jgi:hypothetical protein
MFRLYKRRLFTRRCIAIGIGVILAIGSFPGIAIACEGAGEEWQLEELEGGEIAVDVTRPARACEGNMLVENTSRVAVAILILRENGLECTIRRKECEGRTLNQRGTCTSPLERPGRTPEYELEVEWNRRRATRRFPA